MNVTLDGRGWAQAKHDRPSWRPSETGRTRRGLPWTIAEDRALLQRVAKVAVISWADATIRVIADAHGRSSSAIVTRVAALRAGIQFAMAAKVLR